MNVSLGDARDRSRLTATSLGSIRRCPRVYFYRYALGLSRVRKATALRFDVTDDAGVRAAADRVAEAVGGGNLAGLVNNAGIAVAGATRPD